MKYEIVGRKKEIKKLDEIFASNEAEFLALYGRRRVGRNRPGPTNNCFLP
jgi:AAA+ ATPase superfamily predicted ATPase